MILYASGARPGAYVPDKWSIVGSPNRPINAHHADRTKSPEPGVLAAALAHFVESRGKWYLVNDGLDDAYVLSTGATPLKRGTQVELTPGARIVFGRKENFRIAYVQMMRTA